MAGEINKLYTIGYHALRGVYALLNQAIPLDATIVDIRFKPWSQREEWREESLLRELADLQFGGLKCRYVHIVELGNVNYNRPGAPIQLLHEEHGIGRLQMQLLAKPCILLCQCPDVGRCHRKLVAELAAKWLGCEVEHLAVSKGGWALRAGQTPINEPVVQQEPKPAPTGQMSMW
jgi:hypothetical protein